MELTLKNIKEAQKNIQHIVNKTPLIFDYVTSHKFGGRIYLKLENTHIVQSFKIRGAANAIFKLTPQQKELGVITASAGNHAQGVAYSATKLGIKSIIVMPNCTPLNKVQATLGFGGEVIFGPTAFFDDANKLAKEMAQKQGYVYIPPYDHIDVMAGQGTIGLEILEQNPNIDLVICQIGGGGLMAGVATAIKAIKPNCEIIGVQSENFPDARDIFKGNTLKCKNRYVTGAADGIQVKQPSNYAMKIMKKYVSDIVTVTNQEIEEAIAWLGEKSKIIAEGAGATGMAAILSNKINIAGKNVAVIISGANIDVDRWICYCLSTLTKEKRKISFSFWFTKKSYSILIQALQSIGGRIYLIKGHVATLDCECEMTNGWNHLTLYAPSAKKMDLFFDKLKQDKVKFRFLK